MASANVIVRVVVQRDDLRAIVRRPTGACRVIELAIRFCRWMDQQPTTPSWPEVSVQFGVSRATAYRWLRAYVDAAEIAPFTAADRSRNS